MANPFEVVELANQDGIAFYGVEDIDEG